MEHSEKEISTKVEFDPTRFETEFKFEKEEELSHYDEFTDLPEGLDGATQNPTNTSPLSPNPTRNAQQKSTFGKLLHTIQHSPTGRKLTYVVSSTSAAIKRQTDNLDAWNFFTDLGLPVGIGKVPIGTLKEHRTLINLCAENNTPLKFVVSALTELEHERILGGIAANNETWTAKGRNIKFSNVPLPDFIKKIPRTKAKLTSLNNLVDEVIKHWESQLDEATQKALFKQWQQDPNKAIDIFKQIQEPKMIVFHCKAGQTRSVSECLICLLSMYAHLYGKYSDNKNVPLTKDELQTFMYKVIDHLSTIRPQVDMMKDNQQPLREDILSFGQYYYHRQYAKVAELNNSPVEEIQHAETSEFKA